MIISTGMTIQTIYSDFELFIDDHFMSPPTLLVAIGVLLLLVSTFGCVGAIRESTMLINIVSICKHFREDQRIKLNLFRPVRSPLGLHLCLGSGCCYCSLCPAQPNPGDALADYDFRFAVLPSQGIRARLCGLYAAIRKSNNNNLLCLF